MPDPSDQLCGLKATSRDRRRPRTVICDLCDRATLKFGLLPPAQETPEIIALHEMALLWHEIYLAEVYDANPQRTALKTATTMFCDFYPLLKPAARAAERDYRDA